MQISGVGGQMPIGAAKTNPATPRAEAGPTAGPAFAPQDSLQISDAARALSEADGPADAGRAALLARVKAEIDAGTYDTAEKLESAVGRMLDGLG